MVLENKKDYVLPLYLLKELDENSKIYLTLKLYAPGDFV